MPSVSAAINVFVRASTYVRFAGRNAEVEWQRRMSFVSFSESELLRESAWVILCSGFREAVVRRVFGYISLCFCDWESSSAIVSAGPVCKGAAREVFKNDAKLAAISKVAEVINGFGFDQFKRAVLANPIEELSRLPFIGPTTVWHLAKNLGLDVAKPDRHLVRLAKLLEFRDPSALCATLSAVSGEEEKVVDLILWRYLADNPGVADKCAELV